MTVRTSERIHWVLLAATLAIALFTQRSAAADSSTDEPEWEAKIYAFAWLPALYSHPSIGPFTTNINVTRRKETK